MALLKEKRQAVISHAVTRGPNPHAPLKSSGIEWMGDVPDHRVARTFAKASTKTTNGFVGPTRDILVDAGTLYIQATPIKHGRVNFDAGCFVQPDSSAAYSKSIGCDGDVFIVQTGAMHPHLNYGEIKFVDLPLPPLAEPLGIVSSISKSADQLNTLATEAQRARGRFNA